MQTLSQTGAVIEVNRSTVMRMRDEACSRFGEVEPCGAQTSFENCLTVVGDELILWFNSNDGSTHVVRRALSS